MVVRKLHSLAAGLGPAVLLGGVALLIAVAMPEAVAEAQPLELKINKARTDRYGDALPAGTLARLGTVRYRFGEVTIAFLPDNKTVVSLMGSHAISFWEARTGRLLREIDTSPLTLGDRAYAVSRDAKRLAVGGSLRDDTWGWRTVVRAYDTASGKELRTFVREPRDGVHALALSHDGELLFSLGREGNLRIEEVATGAELLRQKVPGDIMASLALSPDGSTLAVACGPNSRKLLVWKWQTNKEPRELKTADRVGETLAFSPDGKLLAETSDYSPTVFLWDVAGGRVAHKLESPGHQPYRHYSLVFSPDGKMVAAAGSTNDRRSVHLWEPVTGKFLRRLDVGSGRLAFSPDGTLLAAGSRVWEFAAGKELSANDEAHRGAVERIVTARDNLVVTASEDHTIRIWDAATGKQRLQLAHDSMIGWIRALALSPDGSQLVSSSMRDDRVYLWDALTGNRIYRLAGHGRLGNIAADAVFMPDGKSFLTWGAADMYLRQWDVRTGKALLEHAIRPTGVRIADEDTEPFQRDMFFDLGPGCLTPDGKHFILEAIGNFFVFDTATGKEMRKFPSESGSVTRLTVSPDSKLLLASAWGKQVQKKLPDGRTMFSTQNHLVTWWDLATGKRRGEFVLAEAQTAPVAFSPDGKSFAVASSRPDHCIRLVELATGRELRKFTGFRGRVSSLAFMPDGKRLVAGMQDTTALVWDVTGLLQDGRLPKLDLRPDELERLWSDLSGADGIRAYRAMWTLVAAARQSIPFLAERLRPAARIEEARLARLIAELDSDQFKVREQAGKELSGLREMAEPALRKAQPSARSAEGRRRLRELLDQIERRTLTANQLQILRAAEVLEHIGTADGRRVLGTLARGAPESRLTQEAKAALQRLEKQPAYVP